MGIRLSRRALTAATLAIPIAGHRRSMIAQTGEIAFSAPIGEPDGVLGDGFLIRHGFATENTWYNPGWLHAGEDWDRIEGDTAGAGVYAVAAGEVVFAGSEYPGLVVIVQHEPDLFSMYGHLDDALSVATGDRVERGALLGTVLARTDGAAPSHLHFEIRTFLTTNVVNGDTPSYGVACGYQCPPGPGYWPIDAAEHPADLGWRNPTHVIAGRAFGGAPVGIDVVVSRAAGGEIALWRLPDSTVPANQISSLTVTVGDRFALRAIDAGAEEDHGTSAEAYRLWYQITTADADDVWVQAALPDAIDTGSDGRPSSVRLVLLPGIAS